jgi:hypothetical protein
MVKTRRLNKTNRLKKLKKTNKLKRTKRGGAGNNNNSGLMPLPLQQYIISNNSSKSHNLKVSNINNITIGEKLLRLLYTRLSKYVPEFKGDFWDNITVSVTDTEKQKINSNQSDNINFRINLYTKFVEEIKNGFFINRGRYARYTYPLEKLLNKTDSVSVAPMVKPFLEDLYQSTVNLDFIKDTIPKQNINLWFSSSHGAINSSQKKTILPQNVILIYITPINRYGVDLKEHNVRLYHLIQSYQIWIKNNPSSNINICDILKMIQSFQCFLEASIFLPGQEYVDVIFEFKTSKENSTDISDGLYKFEDKIQTITNPKSYVSSVIEQNINKDPAQLNIYFVNCCRMCNSYISDAFTERIYIYEFFFGLLNSFIIDNLSTIKEFDILRDYDCEYQIEYKKTNKRSNVFFDAIMNKSLSPTKTLMNEIKKIIQKKLTSEEKSKEISRILELSKINKLKKTQLKNLIINIYIKYLLYQDDLTTNFDNTFLKLLLELVLENQEIEISFFERFLIKLISLIKKENNIELYKKVLDCLIMIENKKQLDDDFISVFILDFSFCLSDSEIDIFNGDENSFLNLIVKYLKEKHPTILNEVLDAILLNINNSTTISDSDKKLRTEIIEKYKITSI